MTATTMPRLITVQAFHKALVDAGVVRYEDNIRRIVIDVDANNDAVILHLERWGDERLLDVVRTLDGIEIREVSRQNSDQPAEPASPEEA